MSVIRRLLSLRPGRTMRTCIHLVFACSLIPLLLLIYHNNPVPSTFPVRFRHLTPAMRWNGDPLSNKAAAESRDIIYRWISDSGQILNGTKPPVYGLFVLVDPDSSSYETSRPGGGDTLIERLTDHDFGFSSCHQVTRAAFCPVGQ